MEHEARPPDHVGDADPPVDALTAEPPEFGRARASVLAPEGEIQSIGAFARGLGPSRMRLVLFGSGGLVLLLALLAALR